MLPASATLFPLLRKMCAINAATVLLPLVPVTQMVRAFECSANHNAVPDVKCTPPASACGTGDWYGLIPGDLTTTSNCPRAAASGGAAWTVTLSTGVVGASASLQISVSALCGNCRRNAASAALPSRP